MVFGFTGMRLKCADCLPSIFHQIHVNFQLGIHSVFSIRIDQEDLHSAVLGGRGPWGFCADRLCCPRSRND